MDTTSFFIYPTTPAGARASAAGLLDDASEREWATLLSYTQTRHLRAGETVITEGTSDRALYLLTAGRFEVGSSRIPSVAVESPSPFNEVAFLDDGPCTLTVRALTEGELLRLSFDAFESLAAREPTLARRLLLDLGRIVAGRLRSVEG
jgi:CRP-like cAMP-binding protein